MFAILLISMLVSGILAVLRDSATWGGFCATTFFLIWFF